MSEVIVAYGPIAMLGYNDEGLYAAAAYGILVYHNDVVCKYSGYAGRDVEIRLEDDVKTIDEKFAKVKEQAKAVMDEKIAKLKEKYPDAKVIIKNVRSSEKIDVLDFCEGYGWAEDEEEEKCRENIGYVNDPRIEKIVKYVNDNGVYLYFEDPYSDPTIIFYTDTVDKAFETARTCKLEE